MGLRLLSCFCSVFLFSCGGSGLRPDSNTSLDLAFGHDTGAEFIGGDGLPELPDLPFDSLQDAASVSDQRDSGCLAGTDGCDLAAGDSAGETLDSTPDVPPADEMVTDGQEDLEDLADSNLADVSLTDNTEELLADVDVTEPGPVWDNSVYGPAGSPVPVVGHGAGTVGGLQDGHDVYTVTSLDDDGAGTLRDALRSNGLPRLVLFEVDGTINLLSALIVPSNITIDARARDIIIHGKGFVIPGSDQVIIINLALEDIGPDSEDGFQIGSALPDPSEYVVLDHIRLTQHGDGGNAKNVDEAISVVFGSRNITIAWCRFEAWEKVLLAGNGDADAALDSQITITWHHSYAYSTGRRHPQARYGRYHLFNNFWDDWHMYGPALLDPYPESFGSQIQDNGRMLLEGQMVRRFPHQWELFTTANEASRCESGGDLLEYGTWTDPASTAPLKFGVGCAKNQAYDLPYVVEPEVASEALRDRVMSLSGNTLSN